MGASEKSAQIEKKKCITPMFRVSFPSVFQPKAFEGQEGPGKYQLTMLFDKATDISALKKAAFNAAAEKWGPKKEKWPKFKHPWLRDGDEKEDLEGYSGCVFVVAKSNNQPGVIDAKLKPILDPNGLYAGCYARAEVLAYAYDKAGNKGVGFSLQNVQKMKDGEKLSGRRDASEVFDEVEDSSDDEDSYGDADESGDDDMGLEA